MKKNYMCISVMCAGKIKTLSKQTYILKLGELNLNKKKPKTFL